MNTLEEIFYAIFDETERKPEMLTLTRVLYGMEMGDTMTTSELWPYIWRAERKASGDAEIELIIYAQELYREIAGAWAE